MMTLLALALAAGGPAPAAAQATDRPPRAPVAERDGKADAIAAALGVRIDSVLEVQEGGQIVRPLFAGAMMARAAEAATPVEPGQVSVTASVTIRYRIVDARGNR